MILAILTLVVLLLLAVIIGMLRIRDEVELVMKEVAHLKQLSLNPRTRATQASMQSGAITNEQVARKLGRSSVSKRVVVGGEDEAILNQQLNRTPEDSDG